MKLFRRKEKVKEDPYYNKIIEELSKPACQREGGHHMWRDFPPYLIFSWNGMKESSTIYIREPYVCTLCHKMELKDLEGRAYSDFTYEEFLEQVQYFKKMYKDILKPQAVVMDMVNDAIMVDRQKLQMWDQLHAAEPPKKEPFEFKIKEDVSNDKDIYKKANSN